MPGRKNWELEFEEFAMGVENCELGIHSWGEEWEELGVESFGTVEHGWEFRTELVG